jgi:hypothetical protein
MLSFHNDKKVKAKYLARVIGHQQADHLVRGLGWDGTKGCAVGCTLENYNHTAYETELGIPEWLARVEDTLFEGMSERKSRTWPERFLRAIPVGVDLEQVRRKFLAIVLKSSLKSMRAAKFDKKKNPDVVAAIKQSTAAVKEMIRCHEKGLDTAAAESAAWSAASAARSAAESAASAARSAAESAASAAWSAAESAASAAWSAAESAAHAASAAESAAWSAAYDDFADQLLKLLRAAK